MKNYFELNKEERTALLEERKREPRPEHFAKQQSEVVVEEEVTEEEVPVEETPVVEEPTADAPKKSKKSKNKTNGN